MAVVDSGGDGKCKLSVRSGDSDVKSSASGMRVCGGMLVRDGPGS